MAFCSYSRRALSDFSPFFSDVQINPHSAASFIPAVFPILSFSLKVRAGLTGVSGSIDVLKAPNIGFVFAPFLRHRPSLKLFALTGKIFLQFKAHTRRRCGSCGKLIPRGNAENFSLRGVCAIVNRNCPPFSKP